MASVADALHIALDHQLAGRVTEAAILYRRILDVAPGEANAHHLLGLLLCQSGDSATGVAHLTRAVVLAPGHGEIAANFAKALLAAGRNAVAVPALDHARRLLPQNAEMPAYLALLAAEAGQWRLSLSAARQLTVLQPGLADAWGRSGTAAHTLFQAVEAAKALYRQAIIRGVDGDAWRSAGAAFRSFNDNVQALACFSRAWLINPADAAALSTAANTCSDSGNLPRAVTLHARAVQVSGNDPTMRWNQAVTLLLTGDYPAGWEAWESRWNARGFPTPPRHQNLPLWQGEPTAGRTILLYEEQGRGDAIQFARYAPLVAATGARVVLEVGADLTRLCRSLAGAADGRITVVEVGAALPPCDWRCPLMSLPHAFATTLETVPASVPYLHADPARVAHWRGQRRPNGGKAVGLVWGGNPAFAGDRSRSPGLAPLLPLAAISGITVYALQVGPARVDLETRPTAPLVDWGRDVPDFAEAAARMAALDTVVSSCTASLHLAGSLGLPAYGLLAHSADWRWLSHRDDSPWYPTLRLIRQPTPGDWKSVVQSLITLLAS